MYTFIFLGIIFYFFITAFYKKKIHKKSIEIISSKVDIKERQNDNLVETLFTNIKHNVNFNESNTLARDESIIDVTGQTFLIQKEDEKDVVTKLNDLRNNKIQINNSEYEDYRLGNIYKSVLNLTDGEIKLLNNIWYPNNNFFSIEYCKIEILKLFISVLRNLKSKYIEEITTIDIQLAAISGLIATKKFNYRKGSQNYKYCVETTITELYILILKHCENAVREYFGHKRKINIDFFYTTIELKTEIETRLISKVNNILQIQITNISNPNEITDIELYSQNTNRWKIRFEALTKEYNKQPMEFIENVVALGKLNYKNPSIENIFFEASKFISKHDKTASLKLYIHYLYHDLKSITFDNKQLTKIIQKSLFNTNEQLHDFEIIVSELIKDKDLEKALKNVSKIYEVKRKKIQLDTASIKVVQQQHSGTVELLNEYLKDDFEDENNSIKSQEINNEEIKIQITQKSEDAAHSAFVSDLSFSPIHISVLELFSKSNFSIPQSELEIFAKSKGFFKNQVIENINDTCYEILDDILIEEEDDYYTINTNYFQRISAK